MKPILVLAPPRPGAPARERQVVEVCHGLPESLAEFSAVVVVNDGGAASARCLLEALGQRSGPGGPRIGVLTFLGGAGAPARDDPLELAGRGRRRPAKLRLGGSREVPTIEYQVV